MTGKSRPTVKGLKSATSKASRPKRKSTNGCRVLARSIGFDLRVLRNDLTRTPRELGRLAGPVHLVLCKARDAGVAAHDGFALLERQHVVDVRKALGRAQFDRVDDAFGPAAAVHLHDL